MKMIPPDAFIEEVVYTHAVDAAFLYYQRQIASTAPNYQLSELAEIDNKIIAHLEGLHLAGQKALPAYTDDMDTEAGDAFVLASVAARHGSDALEAVVDSLEGTPEAIEGVIAALSWLPLALAAPIVDRWNLSIDVARRCMGLGGAIAHRHPVRQLLSEAAMHGDARLRRIAIAGAGELGQDDMQPYVQRCMADEDPDCRFQARRSSLLLRMPSAAGSLIEPMLSGEPEAEDACRLAMRYLPADAARELQANLSADAKTARLGIIGAGVMGDPAYVPWLIGAMATPEYSRIAMDAITTITGVNVEDENLDGDIPDGFKEGPTADPDDSDIEVPDDDDIEWPNPAAVAAWWQDHGSKRFTTGTPYLFGEKRDRAGLRTVLASGNQRVRALAAFELAQTRKDRASGPSSIFDTTAPVARQRAVMARNGMMGSARTSDRTNTGTASRTRR